MEHTCGGMYDLTCEACWEQRCADDAAREELPGESRYAGWFYDEPDERDAEGGL